MKKPTYKDLERRIVELQAQLPSSADSALREIHKAGDRLMASACMLYIHELGGREIIPPVAIRDGLSKETIEALKADLRRTIIAWGGA